MLRSARLVSTVVFVAAFAAVSLPAHAAKPERWNARIMGNDAGFMTVEREPGGAIRTHFEYNDRGRGPKVDSRLVLGADGTPSSLTVDGNEYLKGPVAERFTREGGKATWKNRAEQGERERRRHLLLELRRHAQRDRLPGDGGGEGARAAAHAAADGNGHRQQAARGRGRRQRQEAARRPLGGRRPEPRAVRRLARV